MVEKTTKNISLALLIAFCIVLSGCGPTQHSNSISAGDQAEYAYLAPTPPM